MRVRPTFEVGSRADLAAYLEMWTRLAASQLRKLAREGKPIPPLYKSGVRYTREPRGHERWQTPAETYRLGHGDCEDLATWRAAELRLQGVPAKVVIRRGGLNLWHILVSTDAGFEDPSKRLGMKGNA